MGNPFVEPEQQTKEQTCDESVKRQNESDSCHDFTVQTPLWVTLGLAYNYREISVLGNNLVRDQDDPPQYGNV